jgi:predicted NBD/HSP70 family sugar kinase
MPVTLDTDEAPALLSCTLHGAWPTVAEQRELRRQLHERGHLTRQSRVLVDIRTVESLPKFDDADAAMLAAGKHVSSLPARVAFLIRPGAVYGIGRMLQSLSPSGLQTELFEDEAAARDWLKAE